MRAYTRVALDKLDEFHEKLKQDSAAKKSAVEGSTGERAAPRKRALPSSAAGGGAKRPGRPRSAPAAASVSSSSSSRAAAAVAALDDGNGQPEEADDGITDVAAATAVLEDNADWVDDEDNF